MHRGLKRGATLTVSTPRPVRAQERRKIMSFIKLYTREGQERCSECGTRFIPDSLPNGECITPPTTCPRGCNRGSWVAAESNQEFCAEVWFHAYYPLGKLVDPNYRGDTSLQIVPIRWEEVGVVVPTTCQLLACGEGPDISMAPGMFWWVRHGEEHPHLEEGDGLYRRFSGLLPGDPERVCRAVPDK